MKYKEIKTPEQLLKYMDENIKYGFVDDAGKRYGAWDQQEFQEGCRKNWHLSSPRRLIKVRYGHCFDQVELERDWFKTHNYKFKTFFIWFEIPYKNSYSAHTYLVYEKSGNYYYFEHSDFSNRGIHEFASYEDAINDQKEKHIEQNKKRNPINEEVIQCLHVYEYNTPIYGCTIREFIDNILENAKEVGEKNKTKVYIPQDRNIKNY